MSRARLALAAAALVAAVVPATAQGAASWRLEQPAPPNGAPFKVPLGAPGDLKFFAPNRGLLSVEGNSTIPRGLFSYDGRSWRQLSVVCGGPGDTARIAFAGPNDFWVVSQPSLPRVGSGTALCHFRNGEVVASYSTPEEASDPFRQMFSATCNGPDDCWFGGVGSQDPLGERVGAFHLHWNGRTLETVYGPQGRGVSDMEFAAGTEFRPGAALVESTLVGRRPENSDEPVDLASPEATPALLHRLVGNSFVNDPFTPAPRTGVPDEAEMLGLDSDGSQLWAVGGGAASGPSAPSGGSVARPPLAARQVSGGAFSEVPLPPASFGSTERFTDVAAVPGTSTAWTTSVPFADRRSTNVKAKVARIEANGSVTTTSLPVSGAGRGSAARIAFSGPNEGWMVTQAGWLFHYTDGTAYPRNTDPAWQRTIDFRPNEAAEQSIPDTAPADDSQLFAPPPVDDRPLTETDEGEPEVRRTPALIRRVRSSRRGRRLIVSFTLTRRARVQLIGKRRGRTVARSRKKTFRRGRAKLVMRVNLRRYPTRLAFRARALSQPRGR